MKPEERNALIDAFAELGRLVNLKGRKLFQTYRLSRTRSIASPSGSPMLRAVMAPRKLRRQIANKRLKSERKASRREGVKTSSVPRDQFRPVPGYIGAGEFGMFKDIIAAMRNMRKL